MKNLSEKDKFSAKLEISFTHTEILSYFRFKREKDKIVGWKVDNEGPWIIVESQGLTHNLPLSVYSMVERITGMNVWAMDFTKIYSPISGVITIEFEGKNFIAVPS